MIRPENPGDKEAIFTINQAAFGQEDEAILVDKLRDAGVLTISLVACLDEKPVGHIAFSPVLVKGKESWSAIALGPLGIVPEMQRQGIGKQLVEEGLACCLSLEEPVVFLLGHPSYYPRFGFRPAPALGLTCKWSSSGDHFMVAELVPEALAGRSGLVSYHPAFG